MGSHRRIPIRVHVFTGFILTLLTAAPATAVDWDQPADPRRGTPVRREALQELAPGETIGWLLASGEVGWGIIAVVGPSTIITRDGLALDRDNCHGLWRAHSSRGHAISTGVGYGLAIGALASSALYANFQDDEPGEWGNLGVGLGISTALVGGLVMGLIAGAVVPDAEYWQLVYLAKGADSWEVDRLPRTDGGSRRRWLGAPWVEVSSSFGSTGWAGYSVAEDQNGIRAALWLPVNSRLDVGGALGVSESTWVSAGSNVSAELLLRLGARTGTVQPYLVGGGGWYGPLGDMMGVTFGGGLRVQVARRWAVSLEAGAVNGLSRVGSDKPGRAWIGLGVAHALGTADASR